MLCGGSQGHSYFHFRSAGSQSQKCQNRIFRKQVIRGRTPRANRKEYSHALFAVVQRTVSCAQHKKSHGDRTKNGSWANFQTWSIWSSRVRHLGHQLTSRVSYGTEAHGCRGVRQRTIIRTTYQKRKKIKFDSFAQMTFKLGQKSSSITF
mgnify:CR=1 FL=1